MTVKTATGAPARLPESAAPKQGLWAWLNKRLPVDEFIHEQLTGYYAPKNFNFWYFFGSLALLVLVMQLLTGIFLTMFYKPGELTAFDSVEFIMLEVDWCLLIRYLHSTGASAFFIVVYLHMFRAFLYGSYKAPRELLWLVGMLVYLALMAEAFMGYVLPWGNMSFWGAQVIVNLFGTIPGIGTPLVQWIRGDYGIADATLNRFFALHVAAIPLALLLLVMLHLVALLSFLFLPWLDRSPVKSMRYRGWISRTALALFAGSFVALGYLGLQPAEGLYVVLARIFAAIYFAFFLLMPFYSRIDAVKPVPDRVVFHAH